MLRGIGVTRRIDSVVLAELGACHFREFGRAVIGLCAHGNLAPSVERRVSSVGCWVYDRSAAKCAAELCAAAFGLLRDDGQGLMESAAEHFNEEVARLCRRLWRG